MKNLIFILSSIAFAVTTVQADIDAVRATIAKARAYVGEESAIESLQCVQYKGTITYFTDEGSEQGEALLTFAKPNKQLIEFTFPDRRHVTGFNGYEGFEYVERIDEYGVPIKNIRVIKGLELRLNKYAALENLWFFKPFEITEENTVDHGIVTIRGVQTHCIDFIHNQRYVFKRYFNVETGDLVQSVVGTGLLSIEEGEIVSGGLKFPKKVASQLNGRVVYEINYDEVVVNSELAEDFFAYPSQ